MSNESALQTVLDRCSPELRPLVERLRSLVHSVVPEAKEEGHAGWGNITYANNGIFCYIAPLKDSVNLGFYKGTSLTDPQRLLRGTGKALRHVKFKGMRDIQVDVLTKLLEQAYGLTAAPPAAGSPGAPGGA